MTQSEPMKTALEAVRGMDKLLPCPFCGGDVSGLHGSQARGYYISCSAITCRANPTVEGETPDAVIEGWNTRAHEVASDKPNYDAMINALEKIAKQPFTACLTLQERDALNNARAVLRGMDGL